MAGTEGDKGADQVVPTEEQLKAERQRAAGLANLAKGRAAAAAARKQKAEAKPAEVAAVAPAEPTVTEESALAGAETMVRFLWLLSKPVALLFKGRLRDLTPEEVTEGAREAMPLVRRFGWLAVLLAFLGFPVWLLRTVGAAFERGGKQPQLKALPGGQEPQKAEA